jgi:hypothetical protein
MTGEKDIFTYFEENEFSSDTIMFGDNSEGRVLGYDKLLSLPIILFLRFYLFIFWTIIYCSYHNFVRWVTMICSLIKV